MKVLSRRFKFAAVAAVAVLTIAIANPTIRGGIATFIQNHGAGQAAKEFSDQLKAERDRRFIPEQKPEWNSSYTEAVLYTQGFLDLKLEAKNQDIWIKDDVTALKAHLFSQETVGALADAHFVRG